MGGGLARPEGGGDGVTIFLGEGGQTLLRHEIPKRISIPVISSPFRFFSDTHYSGTRKKKHEKKNPEAVQIRILENPTDKSFILSIQIFCQLRFSIHAFLWTRDFFFRMI